MDSSANNYCEPKTVEKEKSVDATNQPICQLNMACVSERPDYVQSNRISENTESAGSETRDKESINLAVTGEEQSIATYLKSIFSRLKNLKVLVETMPDDIKDGKAAKLAGVSSVYDYVMSIKYSVSEIHDEICNLMAKEKFTNININSPHKRNANSMAKSAERAVAKDRLQPVRNPMLMCDELASHEGEKIDHDDPDETTSSDGTCKANNGKRNVRRDSRASKIHVSNKGEEWIEAKHCVVKNCSYIQKSTSGDMFMNHFKTWHPEEQNVIPKYYQMMVKSEYFVRKKEEYNAANLRRMHSPSKKPKTGRMSRKRLYRDFVENEQMGSQLADGRSEAKSDTCITWSAGEQNTLPPSSKKSKPEISEVNINALDNNSHSNDSIQKLVIAAEVEADPEEANDREESNSPEESVNVKH